MVVWCDGGGDGGCASGCGRDHGRGAHGPARRPLLRGAAATCLEPASSLLQSSQI